jgi:hypothetical protein
VADDDIHARRTTQFERVFVRYFRPDHTGREIKETVRMVHRLHHAGAGLASDAAK